MLQMKNCYAIIMINTIVVMNMFSGHLKNSNMTEFKVFGLGLILLFGCKTKIVDFIFDASKMNHLTKYEYDYKQGKKSSMIERTYTLMFGHIVDSMISKTSYEYNEKGLVLREITNSNFKEKPDLKLYSYNSNDSLESELNLNSDGDTMHIIKYGYFTDGRKIVFQRDVWIKLDNTKDFKTAYDNKTYDTSLFTREYLYENNSCKLLKEYNKKNMLSKIIEYEYKDNRVYKEFYYSNINNLKMLVKTRCYDYSKSKMEPEFFSVDRNNNTIEIKKNEFKGNEMLYSTESYENGNIVNTVYYNNGKEIGEVGINKYMNYKMSYSMTYYENGEIKEERSYSEKINAR